MPGQFLSRLNTMWSLNGKQVFSNQYTSTGAFVVAMALTGGEFFVISRILTATWKPSSSFRGQNTCVGMSVQPGRIVTW